LKFLVSLLYALIAYLNSVRKYFSKQDKILSASVAYFNYNPSLRKSQREMLSPNLGINVFLPVCVRRTSRSNRSWKSSGYWRLHPFHSF